MILDFMPLYFLLYSFEIINHNSLSEECEEEPLVLKKKKKIGKNPAVNTSFLPDKDREAQELQEIGL